MSKATISITIPVAILPHIGRQHGDRAAFFTLAAMERLNWKRWIRLDGSVNGVWDTNDAGSNPLANHKPVQKFRAADRVDVTKATIYWGKNPADVAYIESVKYFMPGTSRTGKLINWPL